MYSSKKRKRTAHILNEETGKSLCKVEHGMKWNRLDTIVDELPENRRLCGICKQLTDGTNLPDEKIAEIKEKKELYREARRAREYCLEYFRLNEYATNVGIAYCISQELEVPMPEKDKEINHFMVVFHQKKLGIPVKHPRKWMSAEEFYKSKKWKELRYIALSNSEGRCNLCGASAKDGVTLHVDHIKPRSKFPELAYDLDNLQVACEFCNMGKSNYDSKDWR